MGVGDKGGGGGFWTISHWSGGPNTDHLTACCLPLRGWAVCAVAACPKCCHALLADLQALRRTFGRTLQTELTHSLAAAAEEWEYESIRFASGLHCAPMIEQK